MGGGYPIPGPGDGGTPSQVQVGGRYPVQLQAGGGTPSQVQAGGGTLSSSRWGGVPHPRSRWGGEVPHPAPGGGVPHPRSRWGGVPHPAPGGGGTPSQVQVGGYPVQLQVGGYPIPGPGGRSTLAGVPSLWLGYLPQLGYPPPGWGTPPPPPPPEQHSMDWLCRGRYASCVLAQEDFLVVTNFYRAEDGHAPLSPFPTPLDRFYFTGFKDPPQSRFSWLTQTKAHVPPPSPRACLRTRWSQWLWSESNQGSLRGCGSYSNPR